MMMRPHQSASQPRRAAVSQASSDRQRRRWIALYHLRRFIHRTRCSQAQAQKSE